MTIETKVAGTEAWGGVTGNMRQHRDLEQISLKADGSSREVMLSLGKP